MESENFSSWELWLLWKEVVGEISRRKTDGQILFIMLWDSPWLCRVVPKMWCKLAQSAVDYWRLSRVWEDSLLNNQGTSYRRWANGPAAQCRSVSQAIVPCKSVFHTSSIQKWLLWSKLGKTMLFASSWRVPGSMTTGRNLRIPVMKKPAELGSVLTFLSLWRWEACYRACGKSLGFWRMIVQFLKNHIN